MNNNSIMNSVIKRRETILRKRELKQQKQKINSEKRNIKTTDKYSDFQLKHVKDDEKPMVKKVFKLINSPFMYANQLPVKYKNFNNGITQIRVGIPDSKTYKGVTKNQIIKEVEKIQALYKKQKINASFEISLKYPEQWLTGSLFGIDDHPELFDPIEYEQKNSKKVKVKTEQSHFTGYDIFIFKEPKQKTKGGISDDGNNNCLYDCFKICLGSKNPWNTPAELKKYLKVGINDKVDINLIHLIEKKLKNIKINIYGDAVYISPSTAIRTINLNLINSHYTIKENEFSRNIKNKIAFKEKTILLYNKKSFYGYDGDKIFYVSKELLSDIYNNKTEYIIIQKDNNELTFEQEYIEVIQTADTLKKASKGQINLYKTGSNVVTALNLFNKFNKVIIPDKISQLESTFINGALCGGLIFYNKYDGPLYDYDIISFYPSMLLSSMLIPVKEGEFKKVTQDELDNCEYFLNGIYKCIIEPSMNKSINHLFRFNKNSYYTNYDMRQARHLGLKMRIIDDNQANLLYYNSSKCIKANDLFNDYINLLYPMKQQKITGAKMLINLIWGALSTKLIKKKYFQLTDDIIIHDNNNIESIRMLDDGKTYQIKTSDNDKIFKYDYGRIAPFLVSCGREKIAKIIQPNIDKIVFTHTDGFFSSERLDVVTSDEIGGLKYCGYCPNGFVNSCNDRTKEFI